MIKIEKRNGIWEAYVDGALQTYDESLQVVLNYLASNGEYIEEELNEEVK